MPPPTTPAVSTVVAMPTPAEIPTSPRDESHHAALQAAHAPVIIGHGSTAIATTVDGQTVLKGYEVWWNGSRRAKCAESSEERLKREDTIYRHLGSHPLILQSFGLKEIRPGVRSLCLEMAPFGCIRLHTQSDLKGGPLPKLGAPPLQVRLQMALDVAKALSYIHSRGVLSCDLSCRNIFLFPGFRVKLGDFGASLLEGYGFQNDQSYEGRYQLPLRGREFDDLDMVKQELFALGCAIYEITTWRRPYDEIGEDSCQVDVMYAREEFPPVEALNPAEYIIKGCWAENYSTAEEVVHQLEECSTFL